LPASATTWLSPTQPPAATVACQAPTCPPVFALRLLTVGRRR
jgi:hypothetical protein